VVGRSDDGKTVIVRCNSCGERSRIAVGNQGTRPSRDLDAFEPADPNFLGSKTP
jgi:hypothetical protein